MLNNGDLCGYNQVKYPLLPMGGGWGLGGNCKFLKQILNKLCHRKSHTLQDEQEMRAHIMNINE